MSDPRIVDAGPVQSEARIAPLPASAPRSGGNVFARALGRSVLALGGWRTSGAWPDLRKVVVISAQRFRTQERNREDARERLAALVLAAMHVPKKRIATKPSRGARERRLGAKRERSTIKSGRGARWERE